MSVSNFLKSIVIIFFGTLVGYGSIKFLQPQFSRPIEKNRFIASYPIAIAKMGAEQNARYLFNIKTNTDELALSESEISTIKVNIEALRSFNADLSFNWHLPENVELIEGALNGKLGSFSTAESKEVIIRVRGFSKQLKKFISFNTKGVFEQKPIRSDVLISSRIEDSLEYAIQQKELNRIKNQANKPGSSEPQSRFSPDRVVQ